MISSFTILTLLYFRDPSSIFPMAANLRLNRDANVPSMPCINAEVSKVERKPKAKKLDKRKKPAPLLLFGILLSSRHPGPTTAPSPAVGPAPAEDPENDFIDVLFTAL
jgi:hypothetical protein